MVKFNFLCSYFSVFLIYNFFISIFYWSKQFKKKRTLYYINKQKKTYNLIISNCLTVPKKNTCRKNYLIQFITNWIDMLAHDNAAYNFFTFLMDWQHFSKKNCFMLRFKAFFIGDGTYTQIIDIALVWRLLLPLSWFSKSIENHWYSIIA